MIKHIMRYNTNIGILKAMNLSNESKSETILAGQGTVKHQHLINMTKRCAIEN